ncbi:KAP family NTPase [Bacillus cereus]|nr:KAP family NTPase [Bacillus cereus]
MDNIFSTINEYLNLSKTNYGIQLNGPWGIGKTYYVKGILKQKIESLDIPNSNEKYRFIYISLNSVKSVEEIDENLFLNSINEYGNKAYRYTKVGLRVIGKVPGLGVGFAKGIEDEAPNIAKRFTNLENAVLCFDDLERIDRKLSIQQVLGYINTNFIEHENIKTLFISNEDQLHDNEHFKLIREKVIGRTIKYEKTIEEVLPEFISNIYGESSVVNRFYNENDQLILQMINFVTKEFNLRTLRFVFDSFLQVLNKWDQPFQDNKNNILLSIFANILLISIDYKKGILNSIELLEPLYDSYIGFYIGMQYKDDKKELTYSNEFYKKYLTKESPVSSYIKMYKSIGEYIFTGHLDIEVLKQEIWENHDKTENEEEVALNVVYFYEEVELDRLRECVEIVIKGIREAYYSPKLYPGIYKILIEFIDKNYIEKNKTELYTFFDAGLNKGLNKQEIPLHEDRLNRYFENGYEDENYKKLVCNIKDKRVEIIKSQKEDVFTEFLDILKGKDEVDLLQCFSKLESEKTSFLLWTKKSSVVRLFICLIKV